MDDAADTTERAPVSLAAARRIVRRRPARADGTDEVEVADILLEAYVEEPPRRRPRASDAAVDALLAEASRAEETPSRGPMLVSRPPPPLWTSTASFRPELPPAPVAAPRTGALAGLGLVLVAAGAMLGAGAVLRFRDPAVGARSAQRASASPALVAAARALPARVPSAPPAPPSGPTAVAVTALPAPRVPPDRARLLLPASAEGHRVFFDGALVGQGARDVLVRCGKKHTLRVGSAGAPREIEPPCGGELDLR